MCHASDRARQIDQHSERALIACRNLIWRTVACSATSQLSVSRKTAHQSFVISLQSRRFACAMPRDRATQIHQHSERALSSAEIVFGAPLRAAQRLSFPARRKTAHQSFVISLLQSRRFACAMPRIAQRKSINIGSGRSSSAEILFGAPLRAARRLSFPLEGKPHIKAL